jgi:hypothetical protein
MTNDYMTLAEIDVENSVAMDFRTKMRPTAFHAKRLHLAMGGAGAASCEHGPVGLAGRADHR